MNYNTKPRKRDAIWFVIQIAMLLYLYWTYSHLKKTLSKHAKVFTPVPNIMEREVKERNSNRNIDNRRTQSRIPKSESGFRFNNKMNWKPRKRVVQENESELTYSQMYHRYNCKQHAYDQSKPLHTQKSFHHFNKKYSEVTGFSIDQIVDYDYKPPYYAGYSPGKGRGLFASRDIKEGELVHDGRRSTVFFDDGALFRQFVTSLDVTAMSCDILEWVWIQEVDSPGKLRICLGLNAASYMNNGGKKYSNVAPKEITSIDLYALRDIEKGEEILYDYGLFETPWYEFYLA